MKIGVDATTLSRPLTGVGHYILGLLEPLIRQHPDVEWKLLAPQRSAHLDRLVALPGVELVTQSRWIWREPVDCFWGAGEIVPPLIRAKRTVVTVYDLNCVICPDTVRWRRRLWAGLYGPKSLRQADAIVTISQGTKDRLKQHYGLEVTAVVTPPIRPMTAEGAQDFLKQKGLEPRGYALTVATLEPRKNLDRLIECYLEALRRYGEDSCLPLVLVGGRGWKDETIMQSIARAGPKIRLTGYIDEREMPLYLSGARAFFLMSRYEGYGMPLAEARSCGTPVVSTDLPEMREAAENDGTFITLQALERDLPPLFLKQHIHHPPAPATYPSPQHLAQQMATVLF